MWNEILPPCSQALASDPWKRAAQRAGRYQGEQQQPRPITQISPIDPKSLHVTAQKSFELIMSNTHHSEILKRSRSFDVLERLLQILQLLIDLALGLLSGLDGLRLEGLNRLDLSVDIVLLWLESAELLLEVVDDGLVLEHAAVVREVDSLWLLGQKLHLATGVVVALLECYESVGGISFEAELAAQAGPVDFGGCAALYEVLLAIHSRRVMGVLYAD